MERLGKGRGTSGDVDRMETYKSRLPDHNHLLIPKIQRGNGMRRLRLNRALAGNVAGRANGAVEGRRRLALLQNCGQRTLGA